MIDIAEAWLRSAKWAELDGLKLRPVENPWMKGTPLSVVRGQAQALYLTDDNNLDWILKKFLPAKTPDRSYIKAIESLVPRRPGFQSGYLRKIFSRQDVSRSGFYSADFASWVESTVLMSLINCDDWLNVADGVRGGSVTLTDDERMILCMKLSENVSLLESNDLSHRDLSVTNVFVDVRNQLVHLIDWDSLFHPSLSMPRNTTFGTEGYVAPLVMVNGTPDPRATWQPRADRFSLAILNAEFLCMNVGTSLKNEGGMFEQQELYNRGGPGTARIIGLLQQKSPAAAALLERALQSRGFDDCPSPAEWLALGGPAAASSAAPFTTGAGPAAPAPQPYAAAQYAAAQAAPHSFALLDEAAFVQLDEGAMVQLN
jgi:serine/threonine protein kinase